MTITAATAPASPMAQHTSTKSPKPRRQTQIQDDAALAGYLASKMRDEQPFQDSYRMWNYQQNGIYAPADWSLYQHQYAAASGHQYYYVPTYYQYQYGPSVAQQQMLQQGPRAPTPKSMGRESLQIQKSSSTPLPSASSRPRQHHPHPQQQQQQHGLSSTMQSKPSSPTVPSPTRRHHPDEPSRRQRQHPSTARILQQESNPSRPSSSSSSTISSGTNASSEFSTGRRSSVTSVSSSVSIQSKMSKNTKPSLSKKLRKVFSVSGLRSKQNHLGSLTEGNGSNVSLSTVDDASSVMSAATSASNASRTRSIRGRSIASLSSLFQKNCTNVPTVPEEEECDAPEKGPAQRQQRAATPPPELPSPVSKRRSRPIFNKDSPVADLHPPPATPFPLHDSPRLRPATSSSSLATEITSFSKTRSNKIQFCPTIQVHETFSSREYDRRCDPNATCQKLSPLLAMKIKQELNEYKLTDMEIHVESRQYTHFFF